ncbi:endospore germination permease [Pelotomaculum sp. FP]|uniref:GerAB/ArcD/ProY family transporter n=1 Tax=Pelotomaculum sp. FP TaxID=261474 RepID=UPI001FAA68D8|nr:endospore germination permease [Pelotomaculum sp. FP]
MRGILEESKISSRQAVFLMITTIFATVILSVPAITVKHARQDAWISIGLATAAGLLIARLVTTLGLRFPDRTIFEYPAEILGSWPGKLVGFLYIMWFLHINAGVIREYGEFLVTAFRPSTPLIVFNLVAVGIAAYTVRNGLEVFSRANEIFFPLIMGLIVITSILASRETDIHRLLPVADAEAISIFKGAIVPLAWFGEIVAIGLVIPYLNKPRESHHAAVTAVLVSGVVFMLVVSNAIAIFGPDLIDAMVFPGLNKYRIVNVANFLGRLEALAMTAWVTAGFVKISIFYWAAVLGISQVLELKDYRPLVLPVGGVLMALSILDHPSTIHLQHFVAQVFPFFALTFEAAIPLLLLIAALARGKGEKLG